MPVPDTFDQPEGKAFERKRDLSSPASILRAVAAFANGAGGRIVIGIDDDGTVLGVEDPIDAEERLANIVAHGVVPLVVPDIAIVERDGAVLLLVDVHASGRRPHHVASEGAQLGTYVRIGSSNRRADEALRTELARSARGRGYDEEPVAGATLDDLDVGALASHVPDARSVAALRTLDLVTDAGDHEIPTNAGLLVAGTPSAIAERFPDAVVHAAAFGDADAALVRRTIAGTTFELIEQSAAFVHEHRGERVEVRPDSIGNLRTPVVPGIAVRELVVNALVHADYSQHGGPFRVAVHPDRIVIENPGLLVPGMTVDDLGNGVSRARNRAIARTLREAGYIEQWGSGIQRARRAVDAAGLPAITFEELPPGRFRATIHTVPDRPPVLSDPERMLLDAIAATGPGPEGASTSQLVASTGRSERWVRQHAAALVERGIVDVRGSGPRRRYRSH